jgi:DNA polymerase III epsilon subunit family exonuclease
MANAQLSSSMHPGDAAEVIVLDTETTGLDYKTEKMIELAAVRLVNGQVTETFESLINPGIPIRHSSFEVHGITDAEVAEAPPIETVLPQFLAFVGDAPYVAHSAVNDYTFINQACKTVLGQRFDNPRIDTFELFRQVFPEEPSHGLSALLRRFGCPPHNAHRALSDAMALAEVYPRLRALYRQKLSWQFQQLPNIDYLLERYLRLQRAAQTLQAEMSDVKEIFKLYFQEGGSPLEATTGESLVQTKKRAYQYDEARVWDVLTQAGQAQKAFKLNTRTLDKILRKSPPEVTEALKACRTHLSESMSVAVVKGLADDT